MKEATITVIKKDMGKTGYSTHIKIEGDVDKEMARHVIEEMVVVIDKRGLADIIKGLFRYK